MTNPGRRSLDHLPVEDRIRAYRDLAKKALRKANEATNAELRASRLAAATAWHSLAIEIAKNAERVIPDGSAMAFEQAEARSKN